MIDQTVRIAAKRAFIRTLAQGYESALAGLTVSAAAIGAFVDQPNWTALTVAAGVFLLSPFVGAARAYFNIIGNGVPPEYVEAGYTNIGL